eukprot:TRINITY_DN14048_c0_g1_i1.p1 TRINITY_DN14048_c0_g1~~TRINITY_DN14048_c0_g1_i1.p1  ORF type:complete len:296 (+),score=33.36 TRINITY_DN14048_c0_g1_i1:43-930(+)
MCIRDRYQRRVRDKKLQTMRGCMVLSFVLFFSLCWVTTSGYGCTCMNGLAWDPMDFRPQIPSTREIPTMSDSERQIALAIMSWIGVARKENGRESLQQFAFSNRDGVTPVILAPKSVADFAYENAIVQSQMGTIEYEEWPAFCGGTATATCDWRYYKRRRAEVIKDEHEIKFGIYGWPLQSETGKSGYCVSSVDEFYGWGHNPSQIIDRIQAWAAKEGGEFPMEPFEKGIAVYGIGVSNNGMAPKDEASPANVYMTTVIRIILSYELDCSCHHAVECKAIDAADQLSFLELYSDQ